MPKGQGYNKGSMYGGSTKSKSASAPMDSKGGNCGVPVGDTGKKSARGNSRTRQVADRYQ